MAAGTGIKGYGRANIFRSNANWEVMRTNHFELLFDNMTNYQKVGNGATVEDIWLEKKEQLLYPNVTAGDPRVAPIDDPEEGFRLAVQKAFIPSNKVDTATIKHGNETVNVATAYSVDGGSITCKDAVAANIERLCWAWFNQVINVDTMLMGLVVDYKKNTRLIMYSPDGSIARFWKCFGTFPTSMSSDEPSYESADLRNITMDLIVDLALPGIVEQDKVQDFAERLLLE